MIFSSSTGAGVARSVTALCPASEPPAMGAAGKDRENGRHRGNVQDITGHVVQNWIEKSRKIWKKEGKPGKWLGGEVALERKQNWRLRSKRDLWVKRFLQSRWVPGDDMSGFRHVRGPLWRKVKVMGSRRQAVWGMRGITVQSSAVQQNCCWDRNTLKLPSPTQQSLATLGNGALEMCQGDRGTEFSLYLTLVYLNLNKHKQLEATILSSQLCAVKAHGET